jgi:flagellar basal-body rod protein FlgC
MSSDLFKSLAISSAGMQAQGARLRVVSENLANASSTGETPEDLPYRRQVVTFRNALDRELGVNRVGINQVTVDPSEFERRYDPAHPSADDEGYVLYPNVNTLVEVMDMREAQRAYEANMNVIQQSKTMMMSTIDLLRS